MAVQTDFLDISFFVSGGDYRNSTFTGTTLSGVSGSGQFLLVNMTTSAFTIQTSSAGSTLRQLGVLQNKPSTGLAADVKIFGVSKVVLGSTVSIGSVAVGQLVGISSVTTGAVSVASSTTAFPVGVALEAASTAGTIFSVMLFGAGAGTGYLFGV
jgi:hypothetical protein